MIINDGSEELRKLKTDILIEAKKYQKLDSDIWDHKPVSPEEFIESPDFYDNANRKKTPQYVWPYIIDLGNQIFSGDNYAPIYNVVNFVGAVGGGKSTATCLLGFSYPIYRLLCLKSPHKYFGLMESILAFMNLAPSADKAKDIIFFKFRKYIYQIKWFADNNYLPDPNINSELHFPKDIHVVPGNSSRNFPLGADLYGGIIDEAQRFLTKTYDPVEQIFTDLNERRVSRFNKDGIIFLISQAETETTFQEKLFDEPASDDLKILNVRKTFFECKPSSIVGEIFDYNIQREKLNGKVENLSFKIPVEFKPRLERNPRKFVKNVLAIPTLIEGEPYFEDWGRFLASINQSRIDPIPEENDSNCSPAYIYRRLPDDFAGSKGVKYIVRIDLSRDKDGGGDKCGFAICHRGQDRGVLPTVVVDLIGRFKSEKGKEIEFSQVRQFFIDLHEKKGFEYDSIILDQYQSVMMQQDFRNYGFGVVQRGTTYNDYESTKTIIYEKRIDWYYRKVTFDEAKRLVDFNNKVEHAIGYHDDEIVCVAGIIGYISEQIKNEIDIKIENTKKKPRARIPIIVNRMAQNNWRL